MFNIILLGLTSFFTDISSEMIYPLVPLFLTAKLGASPEILGLIEGIAESLASLLKIVAGYISDRLRNRKALTIFGYSASAVGKLFMYIAASWPMVLLARVIDRFGKGIRTAPRDALIADNAAEGKHGAAFGLHRALDSSGAVVGVILAYFFFTRLAQGEYTPVFMWSVVPAVIGVVLLFVVRESKPKASKQAQLPSLHWNVLPRRLQLFLIVALIFTLGNSSNTFLLLRATNLGFTPAAAILLYLVYNIVYGLVSYPAGWLSDKVGRKRLLVTGYVFYGLVYLGFALVNAPQQAWVLWALFGLYGLYIGFTEGVEKALVSELAPANLRATAIGLHATTIGIGLLPASFIAGQLWDRISPAAPFYFGGGMGLAAAIGLMLVL